jgi:hypothetical protein
MVIRLTTLPSSLDEMISLADFYLERLHETQDVIDLYPAVLATVHVPDWFVEGVLHRSLRDEHQALVVQFPSWASVKDFANGLKHAIRATLGHASSARSLQTQQGSIEWEHLDWWDHQERQIKESGK